MKWFIVALVLAASAVSYWLLAGSALDNYHDSQAQQYLRHIHDGSSPFDWSFDQGDDLVPASLGQFPEIDQRDGLLNLTSPGVNAFISLNFRGRVASATDMVRLEIEVESDRPTRLLVFHRAQPQSAVQATAPIQIQEGSQTLSIPLADLAWQKLYFDDDSKRPSRREPGAWGSPYDTISNLRIHPATTPGAHLTFKRVVLLPAAAAPDRQALVLKENCRSKLPTQGLVWCEVAKALPWTPAAVLNLQDSLRRINPTSWVLRAPDKDQQNFPERPQQFNLALIASVFVGLSVLLGLAGVLVRAVRLRAAAELLLWLAMSGIALTSNSAVFPIAVLVAGCWLVVRGNRDFMQLPADKRPWINAALFTLLATAGLGLVVTLEGYGGRDVTQHMLIYPIWAAYQQVILGPVLVRRLEQIGLPTGIVPVLAGSLFGLLHYPNFGLMCLTCVAGCYWAWLYQSSRTVIPAAASHAALAVIAFHLLPRDLLWSGSVGQAFLG